MSGGDDLSAWPRDDLNSGALRPGGLPRARGMSTPERVGPEGGRPETRPVHGGPPRRKVAIPRRCSSRGGAEAEAVLKPRRCSDRGGAQAEAVPGPRRCSSRGGVPRRSMPRPGRCSTRKWSALRATTVPKPRGWRAQLGIRRPSEGTNVPNPPTWVAKRRPSSRHGPTVSDLITAQRGMSGVRRPNRPRGCPGAGWPRVGCPTPGHGLRSPGMRNPNASSRRAASAKGALLALAPTPGTAWPPSSSAPARTIATAPQGASAGGGPGSASPRP